VRDTIGRQLVNPDVQVIITTGGTGISSRDTTYEVITGLLEKRLDGFGELFRMLSYEQVGAAAMLSRAVAGTIGRQVVVSLPGSEAAVRLALEKLLIPELGHLVREAGRGGSRMRPFTSTISLNDARHLLGEAVVPIARVERVPLGEAAGRVASVAVAS